MSPPRRRGRRYDPLPRDREGNRLDITMAIPSTSVASPFQAGLAYADPEEGVTYRCVTYLNPLDGWAPTDLWQERWCLDHRDILVLVEHGLIDAALEVGSAIRYYRCRDERVLLESALFQSLRKKAKIRRKNSKRGRKGMNPQGWVGRAGVLGRRIKQGG